MYANVDGIFLRTIPTGETRALPSPADFVVDRLAWFADGNRLVASGFSAATHLRSIWLIPLTGSQPRLLHSRGGGASPSPDGTRVIFTSNDSSEILELTLATGRERRVTGAPQERFEFVWWSSDGRRISYLRHHFSVNDDHRFYESMIPETAKVTASIPNSMLSSASSLEDGRIVFARFDNENYIRSGKIMGVNTEPETGAFRGQPKEIASIDGDARTLSSLSVNADGRRMMVVEQSNQESIFLGDFSQDPPRIANIRRLTFDERISYPHAWTADSRAVIFESNRNGSYDLFKQFIDRRTPETLAATAATEILPQATPDGRFFLYAGHAPEAEAGWFYKPNTYTLMRIPVDGGASQTLPGARMNLNNGGLGLTLGVPGFGAGDSAKGLQYTNVDVVGTGISVRESHCRTTVFKSRRRPADFILLVVVFAILAGLLLLKAGRAM